MRFDLILVSAVWMHLTEKQRERTIRKLSNLLAPGGKLVITLRFGSFTDEREHHSVSAEALESLAKDYALMVRYKSGRLADTLGRGEVSWQTVVLYLPDDGSGDLNKVRHIIVNDSKSSTYKLALLRTLLRIADAHPGAVIDRTDQEVSLPLGLIALYWIKAYKRLVDYRDRDTEQIYQNSNPKKGLAFVTDDGWSKLQSITPDDLCIGAMFFNKEATALQKTFSDVIKTIKDGPVAFIYQGSKSNPEFTIQRPKYRKKQTSVLIDNEFLQSFGTFTLKESLWDCFRLYNCWIEPLVVNQWIMEMQRFEANKQQNIPFQTYHGCLRWMDEGHNTREVRNRIESLRSLGETVYSVWSGEPLKNDYQVDHCLPFAYWPNNDKWNLLPTFAKENSVKRDKLPSQLRFKNSKRNIIQWWQLAWSAEHEQIRFFSQASFSLPNIPAQCRDFEEVFEAMGMQILGVKSRLLIAEW